MKVDRITRDRGESDEPETLDVWTPSRLDEAVNELNPKYGSKLTIIFEEGGSLTVERLGADTFMLYWQDAQRRLPNYSLERLSLDQAQSLVKRIVDEEEGWRNEITWKSTPRVLNGILVGAGLFLIFFIVWLFYRDISGWFR